MKKAISFLFVFIIICSLSITASAVVPDGPNANWNHFPTQQMGSSGNYTKLVQHVLRHLGYKGRNGLDLVIDGAFGDNTYYAVYWFQYDRDMWHDGVVGRGTWAALQSRIVETSRPNVYYFATDNYLSANVASWRSSDGCWWVATDPGWAVVDPN